MSTTIFFSILWGTSSAVFAYFLLFDTVGDERRCFLRHDGHDYAVSVRHMYNTKAGEITLITRACRRPKCNKITQETLTGHLTASELGLDPSKVTHEA